MASLADSPAAVAPSLLGRIHACVREAVRGVAATEPDPLDPFRGLYVSDASAVGLADELGSGALGSVDERLARAAAALGLDPLDAALLALCAAPELDARFGRLVAYLHDDVSRRAVTPRLAVRLLGDGSPVVLERFAADAPLRRSGAVRLAGQDPPRPLADRAVLVDERLAGRLLGADLAGLAGRGRERLVEPRDRRRIGRDGSLAALAELASSGTDVPLLAWG